MKHTFRDICIATFSCLGIVFLYRLCRARRRTLVRVVAFHDVENADWFASVMRTLARESHIISPQQFHAGEYKEGAINVLITFDDGYDSWIHTCLPILEEHGIHGLFFINSGPLDGVPSDAYVEKNLKLSPKKLLTWEGARMLKDRGHTIGGHTMHHPSLKRIAPDIAQREVGADKQRIEEELCIRLTDFAYPFGTRRDYSKETEELVRREGYTYVYTAESGFVGERAQHIPRTLFEKNQSTESITLWLKGGYDVFAGIRRMFRM